jgi:hypothetical protein
MTKPSRTAPKAPPASPAPPAPLVLPASGGRYTRDATGALAPAPQLGAQPDAPDQKDPEA